MNYAFVDSTNHDCKYFSIVPVLNIYWFFSLFLEQYNNYLHSMQTETSILNKPEMKYIGRGV